MAQIFGQGAIIFGVDINPACTCFNEPDDNVFVETGSQSDEKFLRHIVEKYGSFNLIIDEGSHIASHQIASFNAPFETRLKDNGLFF